MRKSRTLLLLTAPAVLALSLGLSAIVAADTAPAPKAPAAGAARRAPGKAMGARDGEAMKALNLTDEQQSKIKAINQKYRKQFSELRSQNLTPDQQKAKFQELQKARRDEINKVLTDEQKAKLKEWRKSHAPKKAPDGSAPAQRKRNKA